VQLQLPGEQLAEREKQLQALPCALVVDHIGRFTAPVARERGGTVSPGTVAKRGSKICMCVSQAPGGMARRCVI